MCRDFLAVYDGAGIDVTKLTPSGGICGDHTWQFVSSGWYLTVEFVSPSPYTLYQRRKGFTLVYTSFSTGKISIDKFQIFCLIQKGCASQGKKLGTIFCVLLVIIQTKQRKTD